MQDKESFNKGIIKMLQRIASRSDSVIRFTDIANNEEKNAYKYRVFIEGKPVFTITEDVKKNSYSIEIGINADYRFLDIEGKPEYVTEFLTFLRDLYDKRNEQNAVNNMLDFLKQFDKTV